MSQKSSLPQPTQSVSRVLTADTNLARRARDRVPVGLRTILNAARNLPQVKLVTCSMSTALYTRVISEQRKVADLSSS